MGVLCCYFRPKVFSPGDRVRYHSRTLGAHVLATIGGPSPNGPQFCHIRYIGPGGVTPVDHESARLSTLEAVAVESPKSPESPDVTQFALKYPCTPPLPPGDRHLATVSPPHPRDRHALTWEIARGAGGTQLVLLPISNAQGAVLCLPRFWAPQSAVLTTGPSHISALVLW